MQIKKAPLMEKKLEEGSVKGFLLLLFAYFYKRNQEGEVAFCSKGSQGCGEQRLLQPWCLLCCKESGQGYQTPLSSS